MPGVAWDIPAGATAKVSIIDSTARLSNIPVSLMFKDPVEGFDTLETSPTWCFLVESASGRKAVFDLGMPMDSDTFAPSVHRMMDLVGLREGFRGEKDVAQILKEHGVAPSDVNSIIWSHQHLDHIGDPNTFPKSTEIVVGQGFTQAYCPGYPINPDSELCEAYFADRTLREINFEPGPAANLKIGGFRAHDFFGDGSFYLLDTPGHSMGHLSALARTTSGGGAGAQPGEEKADDDDTFILMGGDVCHHGGELRPSPHRPLPDSIVPGATYPAPPALSGGVCPGAAHFAALQRQRGRRARDEPLVDPAVPAQADYAAAVASLREAMVPDGMDNVFFVFAHDATLHGVVDVFPAPANGWRAQGWADKARWTFLKDFAPAAAKFAVEN